MTTPFFLIWLDIFTFSFQGNTHHLISSAFKCRFISLIRGKRVAGIATRLKKFWHGQKVLIFSKTSTPVLGPTQTSNPMGVGVLPES